MTSVTTTEARQLLFKLIHRALTTHEPIRIQHRDGGVILMSEEDYEGLIETLELLSVFRMRDSIYEAEADIGAGRTTSIEEALRA